ncbi:MAG TPA: ATP-dependent DNA ligase [Longimicrobiaceae bacterium]|nr:ATP-dependent DNA ligase [Longimicrobiaceae bacterium]
MKAFAALYAALDETTRTGEKVDALARYFAAVPPEDAAWAVHFLVGRRPKRLVGARRLVEWAMEATGVPEWLFAECYDAVGDLAETIALLLPPSGASSPLPLHAWVERLLSLRGEDEAAQRAELLRAWTELDGPQAYVWNKLITGSFRVGVSQKLVVRALARVGDVDEAAVAHRLMGAWDPTPEFFLRLLGADTRDADVSRPYPFFLAYPLEAEPHTLGEAGEWQVEWKWDGIRAQVIRRRGQTFIWSRGEELITERFPELAQAASLLPDGTVLDGEIMPWRDGHPLPFAQLQRRIGRKLLGPKILAEVPVVLLAYDLLETGGEDVRDRPLAWRRAALETLLASTPTAGRFLPSPLAPVEGWDGVRAAFGEARARRAEGLMLKRAESPYRVGRRRGDWWKWKVEPFTVDAVLIYAQRGSGRRASLYTDYTFAVWRDGELVPFAKAYSGLTDEEIRRVDAFVRRNTVERYGPVRAVKPELVFELGFEGIQRSPRHRSGVAVRFPRMLRWRTDKRPENADSLETILAMLDG